MRWICAQLHAYEFTKDLKEVSDVFSNGLVLCALINRLVYQFLVAVYIDLSMNFILRFLCLCMCFFRSYRPDLVDMNTVKDLGAAESNDIAFHILEKEMHVPRIMTGKDTQQLDTVDSKLWFNYLEQICEVFRGEIPHVKHPKIDFTELREKYRINNNPPNVQPDFSKLLQLSSSKQKMKSIMQELSDGHKLVGQQLGGRSGGPDEDKLKRRRHEQLLLAASSNSGENIPGGGFHGDSSIPRRARKRRGIEKTAANVVSK